MHHKETTTIQKHLKFDDIDIEQSVAHYFGIKLVDALNFD